MAKPDFVTIRRIILTLAVVGGLSLLGLVGCNLLALSIFSGGEQTLKDVSRSRVLEYSEFDYIPASATHLYYFRMSFQDTMEVFYFRAPRADMDRFASRLLGYVPLKDEGCCSSWMERKDWPAIPAAGRRFGQRREPEVGIRDVVFVDGPTGTEAWVAVSNWCPACESADLTGKPPDNSTGTVTFGGEMPPLLPPPPPRK